MAVTFFTTHSYSIHVYVYVRGYIHVDYISVSSLHSHVRVTNELHPVTTGQLLDHVYCLL